MDYLKEKHRRAVKTGLRQRTAGWTPGGLTRVDPGRQEECVQRIGNELHALGNRPGHDGCGRNGKLHNVTVFLRQKCSITAHYGLKSSASKPEQSFTIPGIRNSSSGVELRSPRVPGQSGLTTYWNRNVLYLVPSVAAIANWVVPMNGLPMLFPLSSTLSP